MPWPHLLRTLDAPSSLPVLSGAPNNKALLVVVLFDSTGDNNYSFDTYACSPSIQKIFYPFPHYILVFI
jgi:hypothetical protein